MSERNGDKSRFGRKRRQKILQRKNSREARMQVETRHPPSTAEPGHHEGEARPGR